MSSVAVVGDGVLAYAVARQLTCSAARVVLHRTQSDADSAECGAAYLRLLSPDATRLAQEATALNAWVGLVRETGLQVMSRTDALDVGPATTIATALHETAAVRPARALYPVEATRRWPQIRFDGLVAHQPAARRVHLQIARDALERSARRCGVGIGSGTAIRVRTTALGGVEVLAGGRWHNYDAALVIAGSDDSRRLVGLPASANAAHVLHVETIGPPAGSPSVVHYAGLPPDADGYELPGCRAELHRGRLELRFDQPPADDADATTQLWEYAVRWLPGTIVSTARVSVERNALPTWGSAQGQLRIVAPLAARDRVLTPVVAVSLARSLLETIATDFETELAS